MKGSTDFLTVGGRRSRGRDGSDFEYNGSTIYHGKHTHTHKKHTHTAFSLSVSLSLTYIQTTHYLSFSLSITHIHSSTHTQTLSLSHTHIDIVVFYTSHISVRHAKQIHTQKTNKKNLFELTHMKNIATNDLSK